MTDKQFSALLTTITGAALFVGGAVMEIYTEYGLIGILFGGILMAKDTLVPFLADFVNSYNSTFKEDKKEDNRK